MTLSDLEGHFAVWNLFNSYTWGNEARAICNLFTHKSESVCGL